MVATTGDEVIREVRAVTPVALCSFSMGKDALATLLKIRPHFDEVVLYHCELIPGMEFINESIDYFERTLGQKIYRYPLPNFWKMLRNLVYQPPHRVEAIRKLDLPAPTHDDIQRAVCNDAGLNYDTTFNALGMRAKDSAMRAMYFRRHGPINHARHIFYPVFDFSKDDVCDIIHASGLKLPVDYKYFNASFDGLYARYLVPIKYCFPKDFQRILEFFPLAEFEVLRFESAVKAGHQPAYVPPIY